LADLHHLAHDVAKRYLSLQARIARVRAPVTEDEVAAGDVVKGIGVMVEAVASEIRLDQPPTVDEDHAGLLFPGVAG